jgi:hypothetical protein
MAARWATNIKKSLNIAVEAEREELFLYLPGTKDPVVDKEIFLYFSIVKTAFRKTGPNQTGITVDCFFSVSNKNRRNLYQNQEILERYIDLFLSAIPVFDFPAYVHSGECLKLESDIVVKDFGEIKSELLGLVLQSTLECTYSFLVP